MARLCAERTGLFPTPAEIAIDCSCPDDASMCKHVAAVMYGVGARLDRAPDVLFTLRKVSASPRCSASTAGGVRGEGHPEAHGGAKATRKAAPRNKAGTPPGRGR